MAFLTRTDSNGDPLVQFSYLENFTFNCGVTQKDIRLGYCVFGSDPSNPLIVLHPALTGSPRAAMRGKKSQGDGWFSHCIGSKKLLDTDRFTILCVDHLGGNGATTSAGELGAVRELVTFHDEVRLIAEILARDGVQDIAAVIGGSIGGGQALDWLLQDTIAVSQIIDVSGHATNEGPSKEFFEIQRDMLWGKTGDYHELTNRLDTHVQDLIGRSEAFDFVYQHIRTEVSTATTYSDPNRLLGVVRKIGFLRFVTPQFFTQRWNSYLQKTSSKEKANAELESWIRYQGESFPKRFSADALAQLAHIDASVPPKDPVQVAAALEMKKTKLRGFAVEGDVLFPASLQRAFYGKVQAALPEAQKQLVDFYTTEDFINGHDHFLTEEFLRNTERFRSWLCNSAR